MRISISLACSAAMVVAFAAGAGAQGKGGPKPKVTTATARPAATPKGAPTKTTTSAPKATGGKKTVDTASAHRKPTTPTAPTKSSPKANATSTTTATTTAPTGTTLTPVQQKLQQNTNLASKLQTRLPPGTDLNAAAAGFRNLGQFVAAVNVSNNLGLDFPTLKTAMVTDGKSLGQAIHAQKSTVDGTTLATRAERDAGAEIRSTEKAAKTPKTKAESDSSRRP